MEQELLKQRELLLKNIQDNICGKDGQSIHNNVLREEIKRIDNLLILILKTKIEGKGIEDGNLQG